MEKRRGHVMNRCCLCGKDGMCWAGVLRERRKVDDAKKRVEFQRLKEQMNADLQVFQNLVAKVLQSSISSV